MSCSGQEPLRYTAVGLQRILITLIKNLSNIIHKTGEIAVKVPYYLYIWAHGSCYFEKEDTGYSNEQQISLNDSSL